MRSWRQQPSLGLEGDPTNLIQAPDDEAIVQALADLILEAYGEVEAQRPGAPFVEATDES